MREFNLEIKHGAFVINGKKELLLCGEIHYFRMEKAAWAKALDQLVESGCNAVAYYVPWFVHEYEEGSFDFDGHTHPSNDLGEWLRLTQERGLLGIFRPGPYVYAECTDLGIPKWFTQKYSNALVKKHTDSGYVNGSTINVVGHNHPDFLAATERWYRAVSEIMRPYLAPAGNIVMVQLCNEIPSDDHNDHNRENLGIGDVNGRYARYLTGKYHSVDGLNKQYQTAFTAIETVEPWMLEKADHEQAKLDRLEFYYSHYYPEYFRTLKAFMEQNGIHSNFCHNAYNPRAISLHVENCKQNPWLNMGIDCYYSLNGSLNLKDLAYYCEYGAEYSRRFLGGTPFVLEQECGYWNDYPILHGPELYVWNTWMIAAGYRGFNMYLFASGENRPGMGFYGTSHDWQAPVNKDGEACSSFEDIKRSIGDIKEWQEHLTCENQYDIALGVKNDPGLIWKPIAKATDEAYFALRSEGYTPKLADIQGSEDWMDTPALVLVADERMDAQHQQKLLGYVAGGGRLLLCGAVPYMQMDGSPCTLFAEGAGFETEPKPNTPPDQQIVRLGEREYYIGTSIQPVQTAAPAELLGTGREGEPAVWQIKLGKGSIVTAPFDTKIVMRDSAVLLRLLLQQLDVQPTIQGQHMLRALVKQNATVAVVNLHPVPVNETLTVSGRTLAMQMQPYSVQIIDLEG